jgi:hypothetical protein
VSGLPEVSAKLRFGTFSGALATLTAATSPRVNGASFSANATAGRQALSPPALRERPVIPYIPASPATKPANTPAKTRAARLDFGRAVSVMNGKTSGRRARAIA